MKYFIPCIALVAAACSPRLQTSEVPAASDAHIEASSEVETILVDGKATSIFEVLTLKDIKKLNIHPYQELPRYRHDLLEAPFGRFAFRWLQNATYQRPITWDTPLTREEMNENFRRYRCLMPTYEEWSPPFDLNQDNMIDAKEYARARYLYERYYP